MNFLHRTLLSMALIGSIAHFPISASPHLQSPSIPVILPKAAKDGYYYITKGNITNKMNLDPDLTSHLKSYIKKNGNHIAAIAVIDVNTGKLIALAQGKHPYKWNSDSHSALYQGFPAASLFKTVPTAAVLDIMDFDPDRKIALWGGCAKVRPNGTWMRDTWAKKYNKMTLRTAFANSCNSFYAKVAVKHLGLGVINKYAKRFRFGKSLTTDFAIEPSPIYAPDPKESSIETVGKYSAGFGMVGISAIHAAWIYLAIANDGIAKPIIAYEKNLAHTKKIQLSRLMKKESADTLRKIMNRTVRGGTATSIFRRRGYRHLARIVGGKTGTLTGKAPRGLTTWFAGMMPLDEPEIVVAAVAVTGNKWVIKGPHIAAEAFKTWYKLKIKREKSLKLAKKASRS